MSTENSSAISAYSPTSLWTRFIDGYTNQTTHDKPEKNTQQPIPSDRIATQNKVSEQRPFINKLPEKVEDKNNNSSYSKIDLYELLRFRDYNDAGTTRRKINRELVQRLNRGEFPLCKLGIHEYVFEETSTGKKRLKPVLKQIFDFFEESCSEIHLLNLSRSGNAETDFTLLKHFHGLRSLNLSHTTFEELWVFEHMPYLTTLTMDCCFSVCYKDLLTFRKKSDKCRKIADRILANLLNRSKITLGDLGINSSTEEIMNFFGESSSEVQLLQKLQSSSEIDFKEHQHIK